MSQIKDKIQEAYKWAVANKPKVGGYPYLAEALRQAGVEKYIVNLPSTQTTYFSADGNVVSQSAPLATGLVDVPSFDEEAFIKVLRTSQNGDSTFPEFLKGSWETGVVVYEADLIERTVTYYSAEGDFYVEEFPIVEVRMDDAT